MKQPKEIKLNTDFSKNLNVDDLGDDHALTSYETPLNQGALEMDDQKKMEVIADHFKSIMETLGLDLDDDSLRGTPYRVAKMYVKEMFQGLNPANKPHMAVFDNKYKYRVETSAPEPPLVGRPSASGTEKQIGRNWRKWKAET